jgi:hypothetical protein
MARRGPSPAPLTAATQSPLRWCTGEADSRPKWGDESTERSSAREPAPARRLPAVLARLPLACRWRTQGCVPVPAGGPARGQRPADRVGRLPQRVRVRLLLLLAPGELDRTRALRPANSCDHGGIEPVEPAEDRPREAEDDPPPRRFDAWRRRSAIGAIATGVALGLKEIFQPTNIEPVITAPAPGDPPDADERLRVILDPDDPTKSVAILPKAAVHSGAAASPPEPEQARSVDGTRDRT